MSHCPVFYELDRAELLGNGLIDRYSNVDVLP